MKILVVNQFFYPDVSAVAQQLTDLAEDLTEAGDEVTVICGRGAYQPGVPPLPAREEHHGIRIRRVSATRLGKRTLLHRLADLLAFYLLAFVEMLRVERPDLIYVISTPPLICLPALLAGRLRRLPVVYGVHDLYPDIAVALGVLRESSLAARFLNRLAMAAMRRIERIVVLGRFAKERLQAKGLPGEKISVLENWADPAQIGPIEPHENPFRNRNGLEGKFVVLYSGNMGLAHEFSTVLEAARTLRTDDRIVFLFVGGGARRKEVETFREKHGLGNISVLDYQDRGDLSYSLSAGDVFLVTLRPGCEGLVLPCKVYAGMAVARPMLFVGTADNDTAEAIQRARCGWIFPPGDAAGLARKIVELRDSPQLGAEYGRRGREGLEKWNYRGHATAGYRRVFAEALESSGGLRPVAPSSRMAAGLGEKQ